MNFKMLFRQKFAGVIVGILAIDLVCQSMAVMADEPTAMTVEQRSAWQARIDSLRGELKSISGEHVVDAEVFLKGLEWALRYDEKFSAADLQTLEWALEEGRARMAALVEKRPNATERPGAIVRGYRSQLDQSVQPYGVIVPDTYDPKTPMRLDVVLHGSTRPVGMAELRFMKRFDPKAYQEAGQASPFLELHPLGRVENCYRWAGETDVFEAIEDVCRRYAVDRSRIVLRGMSMGASGTWHLGLQYPDRFAAIGPYCGYVDTHRFSATPYPNFVKVGPLPEHQEAALHMLDAVDYAANAKMVPAIACMGEKDPFFEAHVIMGEAMAREGLKMVNLISPGTAHQVDPVVHAEQLRRIAEHVAAGQPRAPLKVEFVTWTLKVSNCYWIQVLGLEQHYHRADISARFVGDRVIVDKLKNIVRFAIRAGRTPQTPRSVQLEDTVLDIPSPGGDPGDIVLERVDGQWHVAAPDEHRKVRGKTAGLQGPIDDAFTTPFLCVRGTDQPWNGLPHRYAMASLQRFAEDWRQYFRGELPIKNDTDVTPDDIQTKNLILFGDPGSNRWIAKVLPDLPVRWTEQELRMGERAYAANSHAPVLIAPNPLPGASGRYVVLNSGHTFHGTELGRINYLLFPRWGDWAIMRLEPSRADALDDNVQAVGYFAEDWSLGK